MQKSLAKMWRACAHDWRWPKFLAWAGIYVVADASFIADLLHVAKSILLSIHILSYWYNLWFCKLLIFLNIVFWRWNTLLKVILLLLEISRLLSISILCNSELDNCMLHPYMPSEIAHTIHEWFLWCLSRPPYMTNFGALQIQYTYINSHAQRYLRRWLFFRNHF